MDKETYEDLFNNVVINGRYPAEKLDKMKGYIEDLQRQNKFLMERENKLQVLEMKNKEFIKYLENEIKRLSEFNIEPIVAIYANILQKYKEIVGE